MKTFTPRRFMAKRYGLSLAVLLGVCNGAYSEQIGAVDTVFKLLGPDHKIVVDAYRPSGERRDVLRIAGQDGRYQRSAGSG